MNLKSLKMSICLVVLFLFSTTAFGDSKIAQDWYERGKADLEVAQLTMENTHYYHQVCFLSHQAIEKYLKGLLISVGVEPERNHYTAKLLSRAEAHQPELLHFFSELQWLDKIYISSRYPNPDFLYGTEEASQCIEIAESLVSALEDNKNEESMLLQIS